MSRGWRTWNSSLQYRRTQGDRTGTFKIKKGLTRTRLQILFPEDFSSITKKNGKKLTNFYPRPTVRVYFIKNRVVNGWNKSSEGTTESHALKTFKVNLDGSLGEIR